MKTIANISVVVLTLLAISSLDMAECMPSVSRSGHRVVHLHKNKENFKEHKCDAPKPQLHYIGEDSGTEQYRGMTFYPPAVVVNRCSRITGCCGNGGTCSIDTEELVVFQVEAVFDGITSELSIPIPNHLACKCIE